MKIGFDIDGVLADINITALRMIDFMPKKHRKEVEFWYYAEVKPQLNPELFVGENDEYIVITGRDEDKKEVTERWVKKFCPRYKKLYMTNAKVQELANAVGEEVVQWSINQGNKKAEIINKEKLDIFFDDNEDCVNRLRELCPNTKIIKYG